MKENGYVVFDITDLNRTSFQNALWLVEMAFVKQGGYVGFSSHSLLITSSLSLWCALACPEGRIARYLIGTCFKKRVNPVQDCVYKHTAPGSPGRLGWNRGYEFE